MTTGRLRLFAAFLIAAFPAGPVFAINMNGAFNPADFANLDQPGGGANPPANQNPEGGQNLPRGAVQPQGAAAAQAGARQALGGQPLTPAQTRQVNAVMAAANETFGGQVPANVANALGAMAVANPQLSGQTKNQIAAAVGAFMKDNPEVAGNQQSVGRVVNAFTWGSQFIQGGTRNFTVRAENGKAVVVPNEGARTTNNMVIRVPQGRGAIQSGNVRSMQATAENGLGFNMTQSRVGVGSGQFVSSIHMNSATEEQNGALNGVQNITGHQQNGGAAQAAAPNVQGRGVDVTFAAAGRGITANWQTGRTPVPGNGPPAAAPVAAAPGAAAPPAGHDAPAAPHGPMANNLPPQVTLPAQPTAPSIDGHAQIPAAPSIPTNIVNHVASGVAPTAAMPEDGAANPAALAVHTQALPGGQNVMIVQLPPAAANATRAFAAGETAPVQVTLTPAGGGAPVTVWASANRETAMTNPGGRDMAGRNGTLSFVVPAGMTVAKIETQGAARNFALNLNADQNQAALEMMRR